MNARKLTLPALAALALLFSSALPATLHAQKIKVGYWTSGFSLGFGAVMEQMKFAEKQGLDVEWVKFAEVNGPTRAIVSNAIDFAFAAPSTNSMAIAADGVPVKIVLATQIAEAQIIVLDNSPIKSVAELKGKKIGMSPAGQRDPRHRHARFSIKTSAQSRTNISVAPGNEARLAQFLSQKEIDAGGDPLGDHRANGGSQTAPLSQPWSTSGKNSPRAMPRRSWR